jgi:hypothetical protein
MKTILKNNGWLYKNRNAEDKIFTWEREEVKGR